MDFEYLNFIGEDSEEKENLFSFSSDAAYINNIWHLDFVIWYLLNVFLQSLLRAFDGKD